MNKILKIGFDTAVNEPPNGLTKSMSFKGPGAETQLAALLVMINYSVRPLLRRRVPATVFPMKCSCEQLLTVCTTKMICQKIG